jgi:hypothetical protein
VRDILDSLMVFTGKFMRRKKFEKWAGGC